MPYGQSVIFLGRVWFLYILSCLLTYSDKARSYRHASTDRSDFGVTFKVLLRYKPEGIWNEILL